MATWTPPSAALMGLQPFGAALRLPDVTEDLQFREFFAAEYGRLRRLGFLLTGDWVQAKELAQDALVRVYRVWRRVRRLEHPRALLHLAISTLGTLHLEARTPHTAFTIGLLSRSRGP